MAKNTKPTRRIGRPPLPPEQKASHKIRVYVTREEAEMVEAEALSQGISISAMMRKAIGLDE